MTEHTPGPWRYNEFGDHTIRADNWGCVVVTLGGIRKPLPKQEPVWHHKVAEANARLIVTAVNCHDELLELASRIANEDHIWQDQQDDLTEQADAILRKVREQEQS